MNVPDWVFIALAVAAVAIVIVADQWERSERWRRDLDKPLSPRARRWAAEHQEPNEP